MKFTHRALALTAIASSALLLAGCTTNGGATTASTHATSSTPPSTTPSSNTPSSNTPSSNTPTSKGNSNVTTNATTNPLVTGAAGEAPTIEAPTGAAPTTLVTHDIYPGTGTVVQPASTLTVQYTLMAWSTGKVVESSWSSGSPATFPLAQVIKGWQEGLTGMKAGGRRLLVIPPALGYGAQAAGPIKANETLIFVVDVLQVK